MGAHTLYFTVLQRGYAIGGIYPVARGSGPVITVLAAVVVLGERPGTLGPLGTGAVVAVVPPVASLLVLYALQVAPVSVVAPARELSIVIGGLAAWRWLGEPDPARRLLGSLIILAGIGVIALSG